MPSQLYVRINNNLVPVYMTLMERLRSRVAQVWTQILLLGFFLYLLERLYFCKIFLEFYYFSFQFFHGAQFVYEEKFIKQYKLAPLKVVGIEGNDGCQNI